MYRLIPLILFFACAPRSGESEPEEWVREYPGFLPGTSYPHAAVLLVRDQQTHRPIANALVRQHVEAWPSPEGKWAGVLAETRTDEYGIAWINLSEQPSNCHWAVYADGYAPTEEYGRHIGTTVDLVRGHTEQGIIVGPFGEPVAGARVEYKVGCAHAPALAETTTDANGRFEFRGIDGGDFTYLKPGIKAGYATGAPLSERIPIEYAGVGDRVTGRVVDRDGKPPAWGVVHYEGGGRGELALLAKDGSFRLDSADAHGSLTLYTGEGSFYLDPNRFAPGTDALYRLEPRVQAKFDITIDVDGFEDNQIEVSLTNLKDGRIYRSACGNAIFVPRGRYRVGVGLMYSSHRSNDRVIDVNGHFPVKVEAREQPRLRIVWGEPSLKGGDVELTMREGSTTWNPAEDGPTHLPATGRAVLWVERMGAKRAFEVEPLHEGARTVRVSMPGIKRIRLPAAEYENIPDVRFGDLDADEMEDSDVEGLYRTRATGELVVTLQYPDDRSATTTIQLPERADEEIVLGNFRRHEPPSESEPERYRATGGTASIQVTAPGDTTEKLCVYLDGELFRTAPRQPAILIENLSPGPHTLIVGARGRKHYVHRIVLNRGETRVIPVELPLY